MNRVKKLLSVIGLVLVFFLNGSAFAGKLIRTFEGHKERVTSVVFSPDGSMIASGSEDGSIKLWDTQNGVLLRTIKDHNSDVTSVAFSPDGNMIASGDDSRTVKLWDTKSGILLRTTKVSMFGGVTNKRVDSVVFSPDGSMIASENTNIKLWNTKSGALLHTFKGYNSSVSFSPDGSMIASGGYDDTIKLWNTKSGILMRTFKGHNSYVSSVVFSPKGIMIASGSKNGTIKLWDTKSGILLRTTKAHKERVTSVVFSPDGRVIASASKNGTIKLWHTFNGALLHTFKDHKKSGYHKFGSAITPSIVFSPDGTMIAAGRNDNSIRLWDSSSYNSSLAKKVYKSIDKSDFEMLYAFTKKFDNQFDIVQQVYKDMNKELVKMHQKAFEKAKDINTISSYNTFVFVYPYASQAKEANKRAYELEKAHYADISTLGSLGKDKKMNKQARIILIEAQSILDIALDKEKNASIIDTGYYMVVNRMYDLAKNEFPYTDRVLTLKESPALHEFDKTFQKKMQKQMDNNKKIESGQIGDVVEQRVDSTKAVMSHAGSDSKMKEFYHEQTQKHGNFEALYKKVLDEYRSEFKKARSTAVKKIASQKKEANSTVEVTKKPANTSLDNSATPSTKSRKANSEPVSQQQTVNNNLQNTSTDTRTDGSETYYARISQKDHYGKNGQKLKGAGIILQQDRANYHKYHRRDREDTADKHFDTRENRDKIKRMLARGYTSQTTLDAIQYGTPLIKVRIYQYHIDVTLKSGAPQTRQSKAKPSRCNTVGFIRGISRQGDGFVAVRKGAGTEYRMIDKIYYNGEKVKICDRKGKWKGIVYGDCITGSSRSQRGSCKSGWVFGKYIRLIAG